MTTNPEIIALLVAAKWPPIRELRKDPRRLLTDGTIDGRPFNEHERALINAATPDDFSAVASITRAEREGHEAELTKVGADLDRAEAAVAEARACGCSIIAVETYGRLDSGTARVEHVCGR